MSSRIILDGEDNRNNASGMKGLSGLSKEQFIEWISRELRHMRLTYMDAHKIPRQEDFAAHVGITWKTIDNLENGKNAPGLPTLNQIVTACDSNLAEFFAKMVTRADMLAIAKLNAKEHEAIEVLVKGFSHPLTKRAILAVASMTKDFLSLIEDE